MQLHQIFIETALKNKNKIAVYDRASKKDITYENLLIASLIVKSKLNFDKDQFIGIMVPTSAGAIISILAVLMAGKVPVLINYSTGAHKNCLYAKEKCGFDTIITSSKLMKKMKIEPMDGMIYLEELTGSITLVDKIKGKLKSKLAKSFVHKGDIEDNAIILFTSGSEKDPKVVQLTHQNIISNMEGIGQHLDFTSEDTFLAVLPYFHVFGLTTALWVPFYYGMSIVTHASPLEYKAIVGSIKKHQVTCMVATPTFYHGYLKRSETGDFSSVRIAVAGGDKLTTALANGYKEKHNLTVLEGYGTTETSPVISTNTLQFNKPGTIGKPLPNVQVKIVGVDSYEKLPIGSEGKILVKGDLVMRGYLGDIEETSMRIHNGWYDTGDMGLIDNQGYLVHRGRLKRFVKIAGEMISLVAVENEIEKILDEDVNCCVVAIPHAIKGSEIIAAVDKEVNRKKLQKALAKELPNIAIPKKFVLFDELPLMGNGKVDFRKVGEVSQKFVAKSGK